MRHTAGSISKLSLLLTAALLLSLAGVVRADDPVVLVHSDQSCHQCHVPHGAAGDNTQVPLWNPGRTSTTLTSHYSSPSLNATVGAPDGASALCLSCHDGSYPMSADFAFGSGQNFHQGSLENSHPVSFVFDTALAEADGALVDPTTLERDVLDGQGKLQCTSCHDVHTQAVDRGKMLRWSTYDPAAGDAASSGFCRHCHLK